MMGNKAPMGSASTIRSPHKDNLENRQENNTPFHESGEPTMDASGASYLSIPPDLHRRPSTADVFIEKLNVNQRSNLYIRNCP